MALETCTVVCCVGEQLKSLKVNYKCQIIKLHDARLIEVGWSECTILAKDNCELLPAKKRKNLQ